MLRIINYALISTLTIILVITYFTRNSYRHVDPIDQKILDDPKQGETASKEIVTFVREGYHYEITLLYDYEINGLIVHTYNYNAIKFYNKDNVFPVDLCLIWGENVESKVYQDKSLQFSQDTRFCRYYYSGNLTFNNHEISNNHIVVDNDRLEKQFQNLNAGDQIQIKGKLVNIKATAIKELESYNPTYFEWNTSTTRDDTGAGACETIYVEQLNIVQKGNPLSVFLFKFSLYGLILMVIGNLLWFIFGKRF